MKLTKSVVERLPAPAQGYTLHWDGELKGFGVRVTALGVKTFILQRRVNGKDRRITIGRLGPLTAEQARREATKLLGACRLPTMSPVIPSSGRLRQSPNELPMTRW